jgi:hypothetical protein
VGEELSSAAEDRDPRDESGRRFGVCPEEFALWLLLRGKA